MKEEKKSGGANQNVLQIIPASATADQYTQTVSPQKKSSHEID